MQITRPGDVEGALIEMLKLKDRLVFMDFLTDKEENVYPMIPAGATYRDIIMDDEDLEGLSRDSQGSNV
jgi:acetolactate synthase-1/2/3 large subunit